MGKFFTSVTLGFLFMVIVPSSWAQSSSEAVRTVKTYSYALGETRPEASDSETSYFYNSDNQLVMELTPSNMKAYHYNSASLKDSLIAYYWNSDQKSWTLSSKTSYEYDAQDQLIRENSYGSTGEITSYFLYENYVNGLYEDRKTMSPDGMSIYYWSHLDYTFDGNDVVAEIQSRIASTESGNDTIILGKVDYSYTDAVKTSAVFSAYMDSEYYADTLGTWSESYAYDGSGQLTVKSVTSVSRYGKYVQDFDYLYEIYNSAYAPSGVVAALKTGNDVLPNIVEISWNAASSSDVTGYQVMCDTIVSGIITGTSYTVPSSAMNGEHIYAVLPVVSGTLRNISEMVSLTVNDEGVVPAENLKITAVSAKNEEDGSYDVTLAWDAPETTSTIQNYRVYYSSYDYIETSETEAVVNIPSYYAESTNGEGDTYGAEISLYVVTFYETGISANSDTVTCVPYDGTIGAQSPVSSEAVRTVKTYSYALGETRPESSDSETSYFYNSDNQLVMELTPSNMKVYHYNSAGLKDSLIAYYWNSDQKSWTLSSKNSYEYDAQDQLIRENSYGSTGEIASYFLYENYVNGLYQDRKTMSPDGMSIYYWSHLDYSFEGDDLATEIQSRIASTESANDTIILGKVDYSYTDAVKTSAVFSAYMDSEYYADTLGTWSESYVYDGSGQLTVKSVTSVSRYGKYVQDFDYLYETYNSAYAPSGVVAALKTGNDVLPNIVEISWNAASSSDVTGYQVMCDTIVSDIITGTSYTVPSSAMNGKHIYAVLPVVSGTLRNISEMVSLTVNDEGVLPAENLKITAVSAKNEEDGSYDVTLTWDAPETTSAILNYRVYYSSYDYIETSETEAVVNIPSYYAESTNGEGDTYGAEISLYVVTFYETGISANSDTVTCVPYDGTITAVGEVLQATSLKMYPNPATDYLNFSEPVSVNIFNMHGQLVKSINTFNSNIEVSTLQNGVYLVALKNLKGEIARKKVIISR